MIITESQYKEILKIQGVTYTEGSLWFEDSLEKINQLLSLDSTIDK